MLNRLFGRKTSTTSEAQETAEPTPAIRFNVTDAPRVSESSPQERERMAEAMREAYARD